VSDLTPIPSDEELAAVEAQLLQLRPKPVPSNLADRIAAGIAEAESPAPLSWSDRCLVSAMAAGAIAACLIVFLAAQSLYEGAAAPAQPANAATAESDQATVLHNSLLAAGRMDDNELFR
jgi:hypothetical protein